MKTLIITIVVLLLSTNILFANNTDKQRQDWLNIQTYQDYINYRYTYKPAKLYKNDTDSDIMGIDLIEAKIKNKKEYSIQDNIKNYKNKKQQPHKFKSTYLDFTILQEENIS